MGIDEVKVLNALHAYCKQIGITDIDLESFITNHALIAEDLILCFKNRFNPKSPTKQPMLKTDISIVEPGYKKLVSVFYNLITKAIVRTNYFCNNSILSFKIDLSLFDQTLHVLPKPITFRDIFIFCDEFVL